jgi:hypothetical protein
MSFDNNFLRSLGNNSALKDYYNGGDKSSLIRGLVEICGRDVESYEKEEPEQLESILRNHINSQVPSPV